MLNTTNAIYSIEAEIKLVKSLIERKPDKEIFKKLTQELKYLNVIEDLLLKFQCFKMK
jgi:pilus assembly protein TadC